MGNFISSAGTEVKPSDAFFLFEAAKNGSIDIARLFLGKDPQLVQSTTPSDKCTAWHIAAAGGYDPVVRLLIDTTREKSKSSKSDLLSEVINKQNAKGQTPLMLACAGGHSVCVRLLLDNGAHLLVADVAGRSALHYGALHCPADGKGNDCVDLLLEHIQWRLIVQGPIAAPLHVHANVIRKFADTGDMFGRTALHCAAFSGNAHAAHTLLSVGADIYALTEMDCYESELPCNKGSTPLHFAAMRRHQPIVVLLLAAWHRMVTRPGLHLPRPAYFISLVRTLRQQGTNKAVPPAAAAAGEGLSRRKEGDSEVRSQEWDAHQDKGPVSGTEERTGESCSVLTPQLDKELDGSEAQPLVELVETKARAMDHEPNTADAKGTEEPERQAVAQPVEPSEETALLDEGLIPAETQGAAADLPASSQGLATSSVDGKDGGDVEGSPRSVEEPTAPPLELPPPPFQQQPRADPRKMTDAYGMTPYALASKEDLAHGALLNKEPQRTMMIELLDPETDFFVDDTEEEEDSDDDDGLGDDEAAEASSRKPLQGNRGRGGGSTYGGDAESEVGATGSLLLWEGVEMVRNIAADPASFFELRQSVPMLQSQWETRGSAEQGGGDLSIDGMAARKPPMPPSSTTDVIPDCFLCPMTCKIFRDPVVAADGVTYEREAIERHLRHVSTSPMTKMPLASKRLYDNNALKSAIEQWFAGLMPPKSIEVGAREDSDRSGKGTGLLGRP